MARVNISKAKVFAFAVSSPRYHEYTAGQAEEINETAREVFLARQRHDNEHRTSEHTPPKYAESFKVYREGLTWIAANSDPGSNLVEWGARAGGKTAVLRYRPLGTAIEIVAAQEEAG